jgi:AraC-like DNA-binding protein
LPGPRTAVDESARRPRPHTPGLRGAVMPWVVIYAIGAAQAALLALPLWRRAVNPEANKVLAGWLVVVAVDLAVKAAFLAEPSAGLFKAQRFVALFPFLHASLFYLYVRTLTSGRAPRARDVVHAAGFLLVLAHYAPMFLLGPAETRLLFERFMAGQAGLGRWWLDPLQFGYALAYLAAALLRVHRHRRALRQRRSDADRMSLRWIDTMAAFQLLIWGIALTHLLARLPGIDYFLIYGAVAAWVCVVGYLSLLQPPVAGEPAMPDPPSAQSPTAGDDPRVPAVEARLAALMAEHAVYREPALTIGQLARRSGYPEYLVSAVINRRTGGSFWDYVNRHRVEAARACLADPRDRRTILDIAYASGFTSKSTFNAAFKREVGETPSDYRRRHASPDPPSSPHGDRP